MSALLSLFANPAFLPAMLAATAPLVIHLLSKRRAREIAFPSLRFLEKTAERTASRRHIEELLLLILRTLAIVLLALALARPTLRSEAGLLGSGGVSAIALADTSLSMSQDAGGVTALERSRHALRDILRTLPAGSRWAVWRSAGGAKEAASFRTLQARSAEQNESAVNLLHPTSGAGSLTALTVEATQTLREEEGATELYILTDGQLQEWDTLTKTLDTLPRGKPIRVHLFAAPRTGTQNAGISALTVHGRAPVVGETLQLRATIRTYGSHEENTTVTLYAAGAQAARKGVTIPAGGRLTVPFELPLTKAGELTGRVQIGSDACARDNQAHFAVTIKTRLRTLLVEGETETLPRNQASFYLTAALDPFGSEMIQTKHIHPDRLDGENLSSFDAVFLLDVPSLPAQATALLQQFVHAGGTLVFLPGAQTVPDIWNRTFGSASDSAGGLLPVPLGALHEYANGQEDAGRTLRPDDPGHPLLAGFAAIARESLRRIRVRKAFFLQLDARSPARVPIALDRGEAFLTEKHYGRGRTILWAAPPQPEWTTLQARPMFVPLAHAHVYMGASVETAASTAGARWLLSDSDEARTVQLQIRTPQKKDITLSHANADRKHLLLYDDTWNDGLYTLTYEKPERKTRIRAVNPDAAESDLQTIDPSRLLKELQRIGPATITRSVRALDEARAAGRETVDLLNPLLVVVFLLLCAEAFYGAGRARHAGQ